MSMKLKKIIESNFVFDALKKFKKHIVVEIDDKKIKLPIFRERYFFYLFNSKCNCCGLEGSHFAINEQLLKDEKSLYHLNFISFVNNKYTLLTKDHIIPRSRGGKNCNDNYQLLCEYCNGIKSNSLISNNQLYSLTLLQNEKNCFQNNKEKKDYIKNVREHMILINNLVVE